jgi:hypothetical protein|tara:strand:- start:459 stop:590 length:132 start_codon:yes stop_codon:yes gene_type:complete
MIKLAINCPAKVAEKKASQKVFKMFFCANLKNDLALVEPILCK